MENEKQYDIDIGFSETVIDVNINQQLGKSGQGLNQGKAKHGKVIIEKKEETVVVFEKK